MKNCLTSSVILPSLFVLGVVSACTYTASYSPISETVSYHKVREPSKIEFLTKYPARKHILLGYLKAPEVQWTALYGREELIDALSRKASEVGADAVVITDATHTPNTVLNVRWKNMYIYGDAIKYEE